MAYTLAKPTFSTPANEAMAAVDVYTVDSAEVINSYQSAPEQSSGLFDKLIPSDPKALLNDLSSGVQKAAAVAGALAQGVLSKNYFAAAVNGLGALGLAKSGPGAIASVSLGTLSKVQGLARSLGQARNISQVLGSTGQFAGRDGAALNKLAYSTSGLTSNLSSFKNMANSKSSSTAGGISNLGRTLSLGAGMGNAVGSILGDLSPAVTATYNAAANAAVSIAPQQFGENMCRSSDVNSASTVSRAISEFTGGTYQSTIIDSAGLAGSVAGLAYAGHQSGLVGTFKAVTDGIDDVRVVKAAALPLLRNAATTGDVTLFRDITSSKVGPQMSSAIPELASGIISTAVPPPDLAQQEYGNFYDDFNASLKTVSPNWQNYSRAGGGLVNAAYVAQNPFMQDLVAAKMNNVLAPAGSNAQSIFSQANEVVPVNPNNAVAQTITASDLPSTMAGAATTTAPSSTVVPHEAFMMLAKVFPAESVNAGLAEHFPFPHSTMSRTVMGIPA